MRSAHHPLIAPRGQLPGQEYGFLQGLSPVVQSGENMAMAINSHNNAKIANFGVSKNPGQWKLEPGYRRVRIDPQVPEGLDWVKVTQETPYGPITVHRRGKHLQVSVPVGVTAEIDGKTVGAGEYAR